MVNRGVETKRNNSLLIVIESDLINLYKEYYCVVHVFIYTISGSIFLLFLMSQIGSDSCIAFTYSPALVLRPVPSPSHFRGAMDLFVKVKKNSDFF